MPVPAGDLIIGLGVDNIDEDGASEAVAFQLEYHLDPIRQYAWGSVALMGVAETDEDEDIYIGAGMSLVWDVSPAWFVESSVAAGYYDAGSDGLDLGGEVQFRTLLGVGYRLSEASRISLAIDHLSNAGLEDENPGRNALHLRYGRSF
ncbi:MAG: acyloxyacyl hydrolase [Pseudomonadota bacterium]